jgi:peptide/nickel transport system substrate-binding protein
MNALFNPPDNEPIPATTQLGRRAVLKGRAATGALTVPGLGLAACSSSSPGPSSGKSVPAIKKGGTLRVALSGGSSSDTLDCQSAITTVDFARIFQLNEPLIGFGPDALLVPILAEELTPSKDATSWVVRVKPGITFHNGKTLSAEDVMYSLRRVVNPKAPLPGAAPLAAVDAAGMKKLDSRTERIPCHTPYAILDQTLANYYYNIVPVGYDPKAPVGTGPFKFASFTPGQQSVFVRYGSYWRNGQPYLGKVVITNFADETSQLNALTSSQADMVNQLSSGGGRTLQASGANVVISKGGGWVPFTMRVDVAPFNDVRVRQAMRLLVDRPQMLDAVFGGNGTVANDVFSRYDPSYDTSLTQRHYDPAQAKSLLKAAGHENLRVELVSAPIAQGASGSAQALVQQAKAGGVTISLRQVTVTEFYGPQYLKWPFAQDFSFYQYYLPSVAQFFVPGGPYNECHYNNPRYTSLFKQALKVVGDQKRFPIIHEMQQLDYSDGGYIIPFFPPVIDGVAANVHGVQATKTGAPLNNYDWRTVWIG